MGLVRFSSRIIPEKDRTSRYRDALNAVMGLEVTHPRDLPLDVRATFLRLPGVVVARSSLSALTMTRTAAHAADGNDDLVLSIPLTGRARYRQRGRVEAECGPGEAYFLLNDRPSEIANGASSRLSLAISREALRARVPDLDGALQGPVAPSPALAMLAGYVNLLTTVDVGSAPGLDRVVAAHVCDLVAMALGPGANVAGDTPSKGVRAARLALLKADIVANVADAGLSAESVAQRHGISPQYVRALFNSEGTTFGDFVLKQRLARVHAVITDPANAARAISAIVFDLGFGDLSYFNRVFRRRYGMTPSEARAAAMRPERAAPDQ